LPALYEELKQAMAVPFTVLPLCFPTLKLEDFSQVRLCCLRRDQTAAVCCTCLLTSSTGLVLEAATRRLLADILM
jgi:hypothetical protein